MALNENILAGIIHDMLRSDSGIYDIHIPDMRGLYHYFQDMGENVDCGNPGFVVIYQGLKTGNGSFENIWFWFDKKCNPECIKIDTLDMPNSMWLKIAEDFNIEETFDSITITEKDGSCSMDTFLKFFNLAKTF